jgi:hypothetical protein
VGCKFIVKLNVKVIERALSSRRSHRHSNSSNSGGSSLDVIHEVEEEYNNTYEIVAYGDPQRNRENSVQDIQREEVKALDDEPDRMLSEHEQPI